VPDPQWIVLIVAALRLAELVYAARNHRRLLAAGGREIGAGHYPLFVLLHGAWLLALFFLVPADAPVRPVPLALYILLLAGRAWVILSLGRYWTTRIVTVPDAPLVRGGPYRLLRHPNYAIVVGEIAVLPLVFDAWAIAVVFSVLNAGLLWHRIRVEDAALADRRAL
jgi:methyltransferase